MVRRIFLPCFFWLLCIGAVALEKNSSPFFQSVDHIIAFVAPEPLCAEKNELSVVDQSFCTFLENQNNANIVIAVRQSGEATLKRLNSGGYVSKPMSIKAKTSLGLYSHGLVPVNPKHSKNSKVSSVEENEKIIKNSKGRYVAKALLCGGKKVKKFVVYDTRTRKEICLPYKKIVASKGRFEKVRVFAQKIHDGGELALMTGDIDLYATFRRGSVPFGAGTVEKMPNEDETTGINLTILAQVNPIYRRLLAAKGAKNLPGEVETLVNHGAQVDYSKQNPNEPFDPLLVYTQNLTKGQHRCCLYTIQNKLQWRNFTKMVQADDSSCQ